MSRQSGFILLKVPNRPGKYRVYKSFNRNTKVAYAEFEMVDTKGVEQIRKRIDDYWMDRMNDEKILQHKTFKYKYL